MISLGETMRRARQMRRLSQMQLAVAIGTSQSTVSEWELDVAVPRMDSLRRWSDAVGFKMHFSFTPVELVDEKVFPFRVGEFFGHEEVEEG